MAQPTFTVETRDLGERKAAELAAERRAVHAARARSPLYHVEDGECLLRADGREFSGRYVGGDPSTWVPPPGEQYVHAIAGPDGVRVYLLRQTADPRPRP